MIKACIALFAFNRPEHTRATVEALRRNKGAEELDLVVFADGARTHEHQSGVTAVRNYLVGVDGFRSVEVVERPLHYGLARSIIEGVSEVLQVVDSVIVLEDDMVTSAWFLDYMRRGLVRYANEERVISLHSYVVPGKMPDDKPFFLRGTDCWGWATWRRGWQLFNPDGVQLQSKLRERGLMSDFDFNSSFPYSKMLAGQIAGRNNSWAILWYASAFLENRLTLYPGRSLVYNIGNDGSGAHSTITRSWDTELCSSPVNLEGVPIEESPGHRQAYAAFFRKQRPAALRWIAALVQKRLKGVTG